MNQQQWTAVDQYFGDLLVKQDAALEAALAESAAGGLPAISVAPNQGKLLMLLAQMQQARRILEIGTLGGYSSIWLARGMPTDGKLLTLEVEPRHAEVARKNLRRANLSERVEVRLGPAAQSLAKLVAEKHEPFDLIFIDADKPSTADYFTLALQLSRVGTVIIVDNVVRNGKIVEADSPDASVQGVRRFAARLATEPRVTATAIQTVGSKGYDGLVLARVMQ